MMYEHLPSHLYPSGILHNQSPTYLWNFQIDSNLVWQLNQSYSASPYLYPGHIPANLIKKGDWVGVYREMSTSAVDTIIMSTASEMNLSDSIEKLTYEVPIGAMHLDFHRIVPGAVDSGYLFFDTAISAFTVMPDTLWLDKANNLFSYNSNPDSLAQLAFEEYEVFAGILTSSALYKDSSYYSVTFGLASSLFTSNQQDSITYMEIDYDNGDGFLTAQFDVPEVVYYHDTAASEDYTKELRLRVHYGSKVVETKMPLVIFPNSKMADQEFLVSSLDYDCPINENGFKPGEAKVSIKYGNPDKKLLKPVILVEGFESATRPYGDIRFVGLANGNTTDSKGEPAFKQLKMFEDFLDSLYQLGYDVIFIDHRNGRDWIQANSLNVIKVIQWANQELINNGSHEKLVVIGASMGGLNVRYALAKMEAEGCCHNTRLYSTFDTPHNGANIPLGLQATAKHLHDDLGWVDDILNVDLVRPAWKKVLTSPGAMQMLINHLEPSAASVRNAFMEELDSLGHPQECRRIALINGSEKGLANSISHPDKAFFKWTEVLPLPIGHIIGTSLGPVLLNSVGLPSPFFLIRLNSYAESNPNNVVFEANNTKKAALLSTVILATHGTSFSIQIVAYGIKVLSGWLFPSVIPICNAVIMTSQGITNSALPPLHFANILVDVLNGVSQPLLINSTNNLTEAPGGTNDTGEDIWKSLGKRPTLIHGKHSFIPSISALDLDTNNLSCDIFSNRAYFNQKIIFDSYHAPDRTDNLNGNQEHVKITADNLSWLVQHIEHYYELREFTSYKYFDTLKTAFNMSRSFGADWDKPYSKYLYDLDIVNGGELYINKAGALGFGIGSISSTNGSQFSCKTSLNCTPPVVRVFNGGRLQLGESLNSNTGELIFREGSILELHPGSELFISENSLFLLEEEAELVIYPGTRIVLEGLNSQLELKGKVRLMPNARLAPEGMGKVVFNQNIGSSNSISLFWEVDSTSIISFGEGQSTVSAEILKSFYCPSVDSILFNGTSVKIAPNQSLWIDKAYVGMANASVSAMDSTQGHEGVHLAGQESFITQSLFKHGTIGLTNNCTPGNGEFRIDNSIFKHNQVGLQVRDASQLYIINCTSERNQIGVELKAIQGKAVITGGSLSNNQSYGIKADGQQSALLKAKNVDLSNNATSAMVGMVQFRAKCCDFSHSQYGINAHTYCRVLLNDQAMNLFNNNYISVSLDNCSGISLKGGENTFYNSLWYVQGDLHQFNSVPQFDLSSNVMPAMGTGVNASLPVNLSWKDMNGVSHSIPLINWTPGFVSSFSCYQLQPISHMGNAGKRDLFLDYQSGRVVNTANYSNLPLTQALADAAFLVSSEDQVFQDLLAIARFNEILSSIIGPYTEIELQLIELSLESMSSALNNAYDQELIPRNEARPGEMENPYLAMVSSRTQDLISVFSNDPERAAQSHLLLAQSYRMAEHFDYALGELASIGAQVSSTELAESAYWQCICQSEESLINEAISNEDFQVQQEYCRTLLPATKKPKSSDLKAIPVQEISQNKNLELILYPNPSKGQFQIRITGLEGNAEWKLWDISGRLVASGDVDFIHGRSSMNLDHISKGIYNLELASIEQTFISELIIN